MLLKNLRMFLEMLDNLPVAKMAKALVLQIFMQSDLLVEGWSNVPIHCATVAWVGVTIGEAVGLESADLVAIAGLLHDARKVRENARTNELVEGGMVKGEAFAQAAAEQAEWLTGFGSELEEPIRLSALSGHASLAYFYNAKEERPLVERIFHVADDLCGGQMGDEVVMLGERIEQLSQRYPWLVGEHPECLGGESWIEAQMKVSAGILDSLATMTVYPDGPALNAWLVGRCSR